VENILRVRDDRAKISNGIKRMHTYDTGISSRDAELVGIVAVLSIFTRTPMTTVLAAAMVKIP
jgi:hypothetical protein